MNDKSRQSESKQPWPMLLMNGALGVLGFVAILVGLFNLISGDATLAVAGIGCGVVLILVATVHRFEVIKGIGIEAKTRDLRREIDNADEILKQIKDITLGFTPPLLSMAAGAGRFDSVQSPELVYRLARSSKRLMTAAGADQDAIRSALDPWARHAAMDVTRDIANPVKEDARRVQRERQAIVQGWAAPTGANDLGYAQAVEAARAAGRWTNFGNEAHLWSPARCASELAMAARDLPDFIEQAVAEKFRQEVAVWGEELEYLGAHQDFKDVDGWLNRLGKLHER